MCHVSFDPNTMGIPRKHLHDFISTLKNEIEFSQFGLSSLLVPVSFQVYEEWIEKGYHGEMDYLRRHLPAKKDVKSVYPFAESAIVFAFPYFPWPTEVPDHATNLRTALYSKGKDYHQWIIEKLNTVILNLQRTYTDHQFLAATDSKPVLERDLAYRAGLGWVGKNTCLIDRKTGSLFFIAEIFCSFKIIEDVPNPYSHDFCGTCQKCIQICPTQAIEAER
ncbi:MAG: epoxyqueuosine reductase, partial [Pseudobdellovibrionaceae bacterium]